MLSIQPQETNQQRYQFTQSSLSPFAPVLYGLSPTMPHRVSVSPVLDRATPKWSSPPAYKNSMDASVAQALEIARDSPDGASDPTVSKILDGALTQAWGKVQAAPESYVMTRDEFAVFNFFQHRFTGNRMAVAARKRYWDNAQA